MFKNTYQSGLLSIFYSCGANPLAIWDIQVRNGHIKRITDNEVNSIVLEIVSTNVTTTFISCPKQNNVLGIRLPFLVMIVKNLKRYFSFEITILDDKNLRRRFSISNFQSTTKIKPFCTSMPIGLSGGWNQIQFNLADFTRRAYGTQFIEALRVQVHANVRLRRIYFCDRLYAEEELPQEFKLYLPIERKKKTTLSAKKESTSAPIPPTAAPSSAVVPEGATQDDSKPNINSRPSTVKVVAPGEQTQQAEEPVVENEADLGVAQATEVTEVTKIQSTPQEQITLDEPSTGETPLEENQSVEAAPEPPPEEPADVEGTH